MKWGRGTHVRNCIELGSRESRERVKVESIYYNPEDVYETTRNEQATGQHEPREAVIEIQRIWSNIRHYS